LGFLKVAITNHNFSQKTKRLGISSQVKLEDRTSAYRFHAKDRHSTKSGSNWMLRLIVILLANQTPFALPPFKEQTRRSSINESRLRQKGKELVDEELEIKVGQHVDLNAIISNRMEKWKEILPAR
jgi:hypothetical protein